VFIGDRKPVDSFATDARIETDVAMFRWTGLERDLLVGVLTNAAVEDSAAAAAAAAAAAGAAAGGGGGGSARDVKECAILLATVKDLLDMTSEVTDLE
jgi:hypothetical protein